MKKILLLSFLTIIAGCATKPAPMPAPKPKSTNYCAPGETENCRPWSAGERAGASSRGHSNQPEEPK